MENRTAFLLNLKSGRTQNHRQLRASAKYIAHEFQILTVCLKIQMTVYDPKMDGSKYESNNDIEADTTPVEDKTKPQKQPKYIAFHNQLLMLVLVCLVCLF